MPGIPDHPSIPSPGRSAWSPRWPTARAPATARLLTCNKVGPCPRSLPWYVLFHLWANHEMGLDGTGWAAVLRHPACSSLFPHQHAACRSFPLQHAWFLGLGPFPSSSPLQRDGERQRLHYIYIVTNVQCPCTPHAGLHIPYMLPRLLTHAHMNQSTRLHPSKAPLSTDNKLLVTASPLASICEAPGSSLSDSSTHLERQRHAARPTPSSSLPKHKGSAATSDTTIQPRTLQPQPSAPGGSHSIWHFWRLKFQPCQLVNCRLISKAPMYDLHLGRDPVHTPYM